MRDAILPERAAAGGCCQTFPAVADRLLVVQTLCGPTAVWTIHDVVLMLDRERENREQSPKVAE
jgi:hypothetical protein